MKGQKDRKRNQNSGKDIHNINRKKQTYKAVCLLCSVLFFCCLAWLAAYFIGLKRAEDEMNAVYDSYVSVGGAQGKGGQREGTAGTEAAGNTADNAGEPEIPGTPTDQPDGNQSERDKSGSVGGESQGMSAQPEEEPQDLSGYGITDRSIDWASLLEEVNKDIYGWIVVPGTVIDYPILQHPEETDYYLEHNLDGSKGRPGCIYTQRMNSKDWSDRNTVIYGHNMRVGTMFAGLHDFEDGDFFEENRYIHIYSEDGRILVYEIFAAYAFSDAHILMTYDFHTEEGYGRYLDTVRESAENNGHFRQEAEPDTEDKIITLSTCIRGSSSKRYLVQGVLVAEGEQP